MKKAIIAMSGGVDSSVAAYFTKKLGYECIGATMKLYDNEDVGISREKTCCSLDDIEDARSVAAKLNMKYYVFNFRDEFDEKVIKKFIDTYEKGGTPNPCIDCNRYLKFEKLMQRMNELKYDYVVTGHYARIKHKNGRYYLKKAVDSSKDQSYVLYSLSQYQLEHILFPLGDYTKDEIRAVARSRGFVNARKRDSQDICFVPDGDYAKFIESYCNKKYPPGDFVDKEGIVLGTHDGIIKYTIGQRKGLGLSVGKPVYVCSKDIATNRVVVADNDDLFSCDVAAGDFNWIYPKKADGEHFSCSARIRYNSKETPCVAVCENDIVKVRFDEPVRAAASGQALVLYDGEYVIGGGTIL